MTMIDTIRRRNQRHPRDLDEKSPPLNVGEIEGEIAETLRGLPALRAREPSEFAPKEPLPDYVQHGVDVDQVGRLAAEAVVRQYEATAKAVEGMHNDLKGLAAKAIEMLDQLVEEGKLVEAAAQVIRKKAETAFNAIENVAVRTAEMRAACEGVQKNIAQE